MKELFIRNQRYWGLLGTMYWFNCSKNIILKVILGMSLVAQWMDFTFQCRVAGSNPGWRAKIPHDSELKNQNMKQKQYCNKFNKDLNPDFKELKFSLLRPGSTFKTQKVILNTKWIEFFFLTWKTLLPNCWWFVLVYGSVMYEVCIKSTYYFYIQKKQNFKLWNIPSGYL